jgi:hypothetical protein
LVVEVRKEGEEGLDGDEGEDLCGLSIAAEAGESPQCTVGGKEDAPLGIEECSSVALFGGLEFECEEDAEAAKIESVVGNLEANEVVVGVYIDIKGHHNNDKGVLDEEVKSDVAPEAVAQQIGILSVFPRFVVEEQIVCVAEFAAGVRHSLSIALDFNPVKQATLVNGADRPPAVARVTKGAVLRRPRVANPT